MDIFLQAVGCISLVSLGFLVGGVAWAALRSTRMAEERLTALQQLVRADRGERLAFSASMAADRKSERIFELLVL